MALEIFRLVGSIFVDTDEAERSLSKTDNKAAGVGATLLSGVKSAAKFGAALVAGASAAAAGLVALTESTREYRTEQAKLLTAFETAEFSGDAARTTYESLNSVLGDSGQAVEAANHLARLCSTEQQLADWTTIAAGVYGTFGDSIPIEGLTEAANETAKVGSVTGSLADALNWVGISEDEFNARLAACSSEQERAALITDTLNGAYSEAADTYKQMNGEALAANAAQDKLNSSMATLGGMVEPLVTNGKQLIADVLIGAMPYLQSFAQIALPTIMLMLQTIGTNILPPLFNLLSAVLPSVGELAQNILPLICDLITNLMPLLIQVCEAILPVTVELIQKILPPLLDIINLVLPMVMQLLDILLPVLSFLIELIGDGISFALSGLASLILSVSNAFVGAWDLIQNTWISAVDFFDSIWLGIQSAFGSVADWFRNVFSNAWTAVKNVFSTGGEIFDGIKDGIADTFITVVNAIIRGINKVIAIPFNTINGVLNKVRRIEIIGYEPFRNLWGKNPLKVPQIPEMYEGGVLEKGQTGYLEGTGAEAVVPLHNNRKWIRALAEDMRNEMPAPSPAQSAIEQKLDRLIQLLEKLLSMGIYLDGDRVGSFLDRYLGGEASKNARLVI